METSLTLDDLLKLRFAGLDGINIIPEIGYKPPQTEYSHDDFLKKVVYYKPSKLTEITIVTKWSEVEKSFKEEKFSEEHLYTIMNIGFNIKDPSGNVITEMDSAPIEGTLKETPNTSPIFSSFQQPNVPSVVNPITQAQPTLSAESVASKARAISYFAMVLMRLAVKDQEHITKALVRIKSAYPQLYGTRSTWLASLEFPISWASTVKTGLKIYSAIQGTLAYYLGVTELKLSRERNSGAYGLMRFVIFQHLGLSGMQVYRLSVDLMKHLEFITLDQFLTWISNPESEEAVRMIYHIRTVLDDPAKEKTELHWKYAKLVDPTYFINMSPKRNPYLTALLAKLTTAYGLCGTESYATPENITAIKNIGPFIEERVSRHVEIFQKKYDELTKQEGTIGETTWNPSRGLTTGAGEESSKRPRGG